MIYCDAFCIVQIKSITIKYLFHISILSLVSYHIIKSCIDLDISNFFQHNTNLLGKRQGVTVGEECVFTDVRENRRSVRVQRSRILGLLVESSSRC
jgi:hypothetical protein